MWPHTLQMTRDECRGILRRLELESYSHVISVFRAQGGLSEPKVKLLDDLRNFFHISQDRHRAEARRVANDEQLSTIAEAISGPNTWQEWSREGRRPYPMLPRVNPQTALTIIASDIAAKTKAENDKLLPPAITAIASEANEASYVAAPKLQRNVHVVLDEVFKMPDIPAEAKKNLKRNNPDGITSTSNKKRYTQHEAAIKHITANDTDSIHMTQAQKRLEQQRFFHHQHEKHKQKTTTKKGAAAAAAAALTNKSGTGTPSTNKRKSTGAAKPNRRTQKLLQRQLQQQQLLIQQNQREMNASQNHNTTHMHLESSMVVEGGDANQQAYSKPSEQLQHVDLTSPTISGNTAKEKLLISAAPAQKFFVEDRHDPIPPSPLSTNSTTPQLVTQLPAQNTKVCTPLVQQGNKNMSKKINAAHSSITLDQATIIEGTKINSTTKKTRTSLPGSMRVLPYEQQHKLQQQQQQQQQMLSTNTFGSQHVTAATASNTAGNLKEKPTPTLISTTPVQKYIVEERQALPLGSVSSLTMAPTQLPTILPPASPAHSAAACTMNIIKNMTASSLNNTLITPLTSTSASASNTSSTSSSTPVFRKAPTNIIKTLNVTPPNASTNLNTPTGASSITTSISTSSGGPQIISNIKLAPATPQTAAATAAQFNIKHVPSNTLRASVKICQSPNGKVFLQPAHLSEATKAKLQSSFAQKLSVSASSSSPNNLASGSGTITSTSPASGQRIAIQKVQIISGPVISNAVTGNATGKPTTVTIGGSKSNMIFLPASNMRPITIATKSGTTAATLSSLVAAKSSQGEIVTKPPNLVVIGPNTSVTQATGSLQTKSMATSMVTPMSSATVPLPGALFNNNQLITEDTPVDIINMPFIVEDSNGAIRPTIPSPVTTAAVVGMGMGMGMGTTQQTCNNVTADSTVTILNADNIIEKKNEILAINNKQSISQHHHQQQHKHQQPVLVLDATDWEMELDQATKLTSLSNKQQQQFQQHHHQHLKNDFNNDIIIDESFEDVIEEDINVDNSEHKNSGQSNENATSDTTLRVTKSHLGDLIEIDENTALEYVDMDIEQPIVPQKYIESITTSSEIRLDSNTFRTAGTQLQYGTNQVAKMQSPSNEVKMAQSNITH